MDAALLEHSQAADHAALAEAIRQAEARIEAAPGQRQDLVDETVQRVNGRLATMRERAATARAHRATMSDAGRQSLDRVVGHATVGEQRLVALMRGGSDPMARVAMARSMVRSRR